MQNRLSVLLWTTLFIAGLIPAKASDDAVTCVKELVMPSSYSTIYSYLPATVVLRVRIGENGRAKVIAYNTSFETLKIHLDGYFKEKTRYSESCNGKTITFTVHYIIEGSALDFATSEVRFDPPDQFYIMCHPLKPSLDPARK